MKFIKHPTNHLRLCPSSLHRYSACPSRYASAIPSRSAAGLNDGSQFMPIASAHHGRPPRHRRRAKARWEETVLICFRGIEAETEDKAGLDTGEPRQMAVNSW